MTFPQIDWMELWNRLVQAVFNVLETCSDEYQENPALRATLDGTLLLLGLLAVDHLTGYPAGLDLLYIAPAWYAARIGGKAPAYLLATATAIAVTGIDYGRNFSGPGSFPVDLALRLLVMFGILRLVVKLESRLETYERLATRDSLTGLFNRVALQDYAREQIARAHEQRHPLVLAMIDCNKFKSLNDEFGHAYGDHVLKVLSKQLRRAIRSHGLCARTGGDEFVLILPHRNLEEAYSLLERANANFSSATEIDGEGATISFGLARLGEHGETFEELLKAADRFMYIAKGGKAVVRLPEPVRTSA